MIEIQVAKEFTEAVAEDWLRLAALAVLAHQEKPHDSDITIVVSDDRQLQELNHQYLGIDEPTDVLSFASDAVNPESSRAYLGDVIISYPKAKAQAEERGHAETEELQLLVVHGCLHLLGFDHDTPANKAQMWLAQDEILSTLGVKARPA